MSVLNALELFAGIGGIPLGTEAAGVARTVALCEIDPYAQAVLRKQFPGVPIHDDVRTLHIKPGDADLIAGGFPCQPWSTAGQQKGTQDERHLWPEFARLIREGQPQHVLGENVAAILSGREAGVCEACERGVVRVSILYGCQLCKAEFSVPTDACLACGSEDPDWTERREPCEPRPCDECSGTGVVAARLPGISECFSDLTALGMDLCWDCVPASSVGAPHRRDRVFILAWRRDGAGSINPPLRASERAYASGIARVLAKFEAGAKSQGNYRWPARPGQAQYDFEPPRTARDIPNRADRLKCLGNAVVGPVAEAVGYALQHLRVEGGADYPGFDMDTDPFGARMQTEHDRWCAELRQADAGTVTELARLVGKVFCLPQADMFAPATPVLRWPRAGTIRNGRVYEMTPAAPLSRKGFHWNTPTVEDGGRNGSPEWAQRWAAGERIPDHQQRLRTQIHAHPTSPAQWATPVASMPNDGEPVASWAERRERVKATGKNGNGMGMPLGVQVRWPTPNAIDGTTGTRAQSGANATQWGGNNSVPALVGAIERGDQWATPRASENENRQTKLSPSQKAGQHGLNLAAQVNAPYPAAEWEEKEWPTPRATEVPETPETRDARLAKQKEAYAAGGPRWGGSESLATSVQRTAPERQWYTPTSALGHSDRMAEAKPTQGMGDRHRRLIAGSLLEQLSAEIFPAKIDAETPPEQPVQRHDWPSPIARDYKDTGDMSTVNAREGRPPDTVARVVQATAPAGGDVAPLNADWVECLQGFPVGWTRVDDYVKPAVNKKKTVT